MEKQQKLKVIAILKSLIDGNIIQLDNMQISLVNSKFKGQIGHLILPLDEYPLGRFLNLASEISDVYYKELTSNLSKERCTI